MDLERDGVPFENYLLHPPRAAVRFCYTACQASRDVPAAMALIARQSCTCRTSARR
jgi:hypothetical protein